MYMQAHQCQLIEVEYQCHFYCDSFLKRGLCHTVQTPKSAPEGYMKGAGEPAFAAVLRRGVHYVLQLVIAGAHDDRARGTFHRLSSLDDELWHTCCQAQQSEKVHKLWQSSIRCIQRDRLTKV